MVKNQEGLEGESENYQFYWAPLQGSYYADALKVIVIDEEEEPEYDEEEAVDEDLQIGFQERQEQINNLYAFVGYIQEKEKKPYSGPVDMSEFVNLDEETSHLVLDRLKAAVDSIKAQSFQSKFSGYWYLMSNEIY